MKHEPCFGKNVSFKAGNLEVIVGFMNKTKKPFSATLNIIIEQWDEFSISIAKLQEQAAQDKRAADFDKIEKAKIIRVKK